MAKALGYFFGKSSPGSRRRSGDGRNICKVCRNAEKRISQPLKEINRFGDMNPNAIRKLPTYHIIILAKMISEDNLYQLITQSHLTYYASRPRIPKSLLNKHREGLIVGSACEAGELYQALLHKKSTEFIARLADFYDYYEIQPLGNNRFMIESSRLGYQRNEDLMEINREIVQLGEKFKKPVVATCDVHFLDPEDEVYRRIIMAGKALMTRMNSRLVSAHDRGDAGGVCVSGAAKARKS